jgi:hypothetical protein
MFGRPWRALIPNDEPGRLSAYASISMVNHCWPVNGDTEHGARLSGRPLAVRDRDSSQEILPDRQRGLAKHRYRYLPPQRNAMVWEHSEWCIHLPIRGHSRGLSLVGILSVLLRALRREVANDACTRPASAEIRPNKKPRNDEAFQFKLIIRLRSRVERHAQAKCLLSSCPFGSL